MAANPHEDRTAGNGNTSGGPVIATADLQFAKASYTLDKTIMKQTRWIGALEWLALIAITLFLLGVAGTMAEIDPPNLRSELVRESSLD